MRSLDRNKSCMKLAEFLTANGKKLYEIRRISDDLNPNIVRKL